MFYALQFTCAVQVKILSWTILFESININAVYLSSGGTGGYLTNVLWWSDSIWHWVVRHLKNDERLINRPILAFLLWLLSPNGDRRWHFSQRSFLGFLLLLLSPNGDHRRHPSQRLFLGFLLWVPVLVAVAQRRSSVVSLPVTVFFG